MLDNINFYSDENGGYLYVCFFTVRNKKGTPQQQWGDPENPVYLTEHFELFHLKSEATTRYMELIDRMDIHNAGIAKMDKQFCSEWW